MWWNKKRKLERLCDELKSIAMRDRLARGSENDLSEDERQARALRRVRQSELLVEIERLTNKQAWRTPERAKPASALETSGKATRQQSSDELIISAKKPGRRLEEHDAKIRRDRESPAAA